VNAANATPETLLRAAAEHRAAGRIGSAILAYEEALRLRPDLPNSWYNLAMLQRKAGAFEAALASYAEALARGVEGPEEVHLNRGVIFSDDLGRPELAEAALGEALRIAPDYVPALLNLGNLHEDRGDRAAAAEAYGRARALAPGAGTPLARLLGVSDLSGREDALAAEARARIADPRLTAAERAELGYALGGGLDRAGAWDDAFAAAAAANRDARRSSGLVYDRAAQERLVDRMIAAFPLARQAEPGAEGAAPIFILGMFRSGSTLAEQILARGHGVATGGELTIVPNLVAGIEGYPEAAADATDKRPDNFLHIGLIKRLFPAAKIVHTVRNPADVAVSLFFLNLDPAMTYATDLADIAHWHGEYRRLMAHWEALWPADIHRFDYDALVAEPRPAIQALFRFTGVPHDDAALNYRGSGRAVRTASAGQVHQPLYARASGRWRHYEGHLRPFFEGLRG
jgi:tetratricopeptide (TPR) repeat protein